ncbi:MAG: GNAT family N-acetyltransferase [Desulfobulbaceae bacterium]|nr:GNAT family N-acetyltransferase [Desulfobulbaceae bacterium]
MRSWALGSNVMSISNYTIGEAPPAEREASIDEVTGCVAFEQSDNDTAYLNRLSVSPGFRHKGIGSLLVRHIICPIDIKLTSFLSCPSFLYTNLHCHIKCLNIPNIYHG